MRFTRRTALSIPGGAATPFVSPVKANGGPSPVQSGSIQLSRDRTVVGASASVHGLEDVEWELENVHDERAIEPLTVTGRAALGGDS